jgi:hypothetical protein
MINKVGIKTTINIKMELLDRLNDASFVAGKSRTYLVKALLARFIRKHRRMISAWSQVQYQERCEKKKWRHLHIVLKPAEYEYCIDLKKVCKLSVSRIIAYSIEHLLDELLYALQESGDNYRYSNYVFSCFEVKGVICWLFCWGIPPELPFDTARGWI